MDLFSEFRFFHRVYIKNYAVFGIGLFPFASDEYDAFFMGKFDSGSEPENIYDFFDIRRLGDITGEIVIHKRGISVDDFHIVPPGNFFHDFFESGIREAEHEDYSFFQILTAEIFYFYILSPVHTEHLIGTENISVPAFGNGYLPLYKRDLFERIVIMVAYKKFGS